MIFGMLTGLSAQVLAASDHSSHRNAAENCCDGHEHAPSDCAPDPQDSHHHHDCCCAHALPLGIEPQHPCRLGVPQSTRLGFRNEAKIPPEGPFLSSEKPPLI
jgi:hypothetical protein